MKTQNLQFRDDETGKAKELPVVVFYNGAVWTEDKYNRLNARRLFRRAVINKHYGLVPAVVK